ncbi:pyrimidine dimer DNA glycosylase/endonuclease V [Dietzia cercidiphylli]|uniref:pyrimidine dimer DNA glycosylase/endonuclease V n=1 Tax=Dietzia cercidiphylli TaxID=498199 RepID=UPI00305BA84C
MRLWSIRPDRLDRAALVAGWSEGLLAQKVLRGLTEGYRRHPQPERVRTMRDPAWLGGLTTPRPHPMFDPVPGPVAARERSPHPEA